MRLFDWMESYLLYIESRRSFETARAYRNDFLVFKRFIKRNVSLSKITTATIQKFFIEARTLEGERYAQRTLKRIFACLFKFFKWLRKTHKAIKVNPMEDLESFRDPYVNYLTDRSIEEDQVNQIFEFIQDPKIKMAILVQSQLSLRPGELMKLKFSDFNLEKRQLRVMRGKGNKNRPVLIPKELAEILALYFAWIRSQYQTIYLFPGKHDQSRPMAYATFNHHYRKARNALKIKRVNGDLSKPHDLRYYGCRKMSKVFDVNTVMSQLGHVSKSMFEQYNGELSMDFVSPELLKRFDELHKKPNIQL